MIVRRYVVREVVQSFAAVLAVLILVYVSNRFVRFLAEAASGELAGYAILELLALKLVTNLGILIPLSLYIAVLLVLGRLHRDGEIVALAAGGYGTARMARSVLWLGLGFGVVSAALSLYLTPSLARVAADLTAQARNSTEVSGVYPGRFIDYGEGERIFYVEAISEDRQRMSNVFVQVRRPEGFEVMYSARARHLVEERTGDRFLILRDGNRYFGRPGEADYSLTHFREYAVRIDEQRTESGYRKPETIPTSELIGSPEPAHVAELQWRLSLPVSTLLLALLAMPLAQSVPGQGRGAKLFAGILVYFIYTNLLNVAAKSIETGYLAAPIGVWPVHLALAMTVSLLVFHHEHYRWHPARAARAWRRWRRRVR